jgi:hypothetical protein
MPFQKSRDRLRNLRFLAAVEMTLLDCATLESRTCALHLYAGIKVKIKKLIITHDQLGNAEKV